MNCDFLFFNFYCNIIFFITLYYMLFRIIFYYIELFCYGEAELVHQTVLCKLQKPHVSMAVVCELLWFHFVLLDAD